MAAKEAATDRSKPDTTLALPGNKQCDPGSNRATTPGASPGGTRTLLSRHNLHRTYQGALAKLADPAVPLRPAARRVLRILRDLGPCDIDRLVTQLPTAGRRSIRLATVAVALGELQAAGLASVNVDDQDELAGPVVGAADGAMIPCSTRLICTAPTTSPHLRDVAGGRRHSGPGHRRTDGA